MGCLELREAGVILFFCPGQQGCLEPLPALCRTEELWEGANRPTGKTNVPHRKESETVPNVQGVQSGKDGCRGKGKGRDDLAFIEHLL